MTEDDAVQNAAVERETVVQNDAMELDLHESVDDEDTVGVGEVEAGSGTVRFEEPRVAFAHVSNRRWGWEIGDGDSHIFVSSDGGELNVDFGPQFAPIETCIKQWQYEAALDQLDGYRPDFELLFDDSGLVAFRGEDTTAIVSPVQWPWDYPSPDCGPRTPGGPTA